MPVEQLKSYNILCLLDVIEHLDLETAKSLLRFLLDAMSDEAVLFISTPLWFYPQDQVQEGDLEEHKIGVPASAMMAMLPTHYAITYPLVGTFALRKISLQYVDFFQPTANKSFSMEMGLKIARSVGLHLQEGVFVATAL